MFPIRILPWLSKELNFYYLVSWESLDDVACWELSLGGCGKGGKCSVCGESGYCCRNYDNPTSNGDCPTGAIQAASKDIHQCVVPKQGSL